MTNKKGQSSRTSGERTLSEKLRIDTTTKAKKYSALQYARNKASFVDSGETLIEKTRNFVIRTRYIKPTKDKFVVSAKDVKSFKTYGNKTAERLQYVITGFYKGKTFTRSSNAVPAGAFSREALEKQARDRFFQALAHEIKPSEFGTDKPGDFRRGVAFGKSKFAGLRSIKVREGIVSYFKR